MVEWNEMEKKKRKEKNIYQHRCFVCCTQLYVLRCAECAAVKTCAYLENFPFSRPVIFDAVPEQCNLHVFFVVQLFDLLRGYCQPYGKLNRLHWSDMFCV